MITQTIKHWLGKLFAWWPWKRSPEHDYAQAMGSVNKGTAQESVWKTTIHGPMSQPGVTSVVVEQGMEENVSEIDQPAATEPREHAHSPASGEIVPLPPTTRAEPAGEVVLFPENGPAPAATPEQRLIFLRYLVKRGTFNEGFLNGDEPDQYKQEP